MPRQPSPSISAPPAKVIAPTKTPQTMPVRFGCTLRLPDFAAGDAEREFDFVCDFRAKAQFLQGCGTIAEIGRSARLSAGFE
jgi:hypothetical protein